MVIFTIFCFVMEKKGCFSRFKWIIIMGTILILLVLGAGFYGFLQFYSPNVKLEKKKSTLFYIHTGTSFDSVKQILFEKNMISDTNSFLLTVRLKNYAANVKPGRYLIKNNMTNNSLINMLRSGNQKPVNITFNNVRTKRELCGKIGKYLEFDSIQLLNTLNDRKFIDSLGFSPENIISMFIPNTYEFYWNTSPKQFVERMKSEYDKFWTVERVEMAENLKLTRLQVSTLASIVQAEQSVHTSELPTIAGLYINRIKQNMLLQSDPTVIFAIGNFNIRRVLNSDKEYDSPYNTYKYAGLPPGPILIPDNVTLDAVLNYEKHNYIFMCAKEDFSGFHNFAETSAQHTRNAEKYWKALNKKKVYR